MNDAHADAVCALFGLGRLLKAPSMSALGWGAHNTMWRLTTDVGEFAVKKVGRPLPSETEIARSLAIEMEACKRGVPAPLPVLSRHGSCYEQIEGTPVRCHVWVNGSAKVNEEATSTDAHRMGRLMAHLHGLEIGVEPDPLSILGEASEQWLQLADLGGGRGAPWEDLIRDNLNALRSVETWASTSPGEGMIGSHRDLNAHNVLFDSDRLVLIDWDAAGPASARSERASYAVIWAHTATGRMDEGVAIAFLRGYKAAGGTVDQADPDVLPGSLRGVIWWAQQNVRMAIDRCTEDQDALATLLVQAVLDGPKVIGERREFLSDCIRQI